MPAVPCKELTPELISPQHAMKNSRAPMSKINQHMQALAEHKLAKRLVMDPRL